MHKFEKINNTLYRYRGVDVIIRLDEYEKTSMLAKIEDTPGAPAQFYTHGPDFERVKQITIDKIDAYLERQSSETE